jgi:DNA helicase II / ATP-dependent DNA helicase PcrA
MKDHDHPEYPLEQRKLEETEALIALEIEEISTSPTSGGNELADQSISFEYFRYRLALEEAQGKPYFGRVDFEEDGVVTTAYIGRHKLDLNDMQVYVYSWQSTAGKLFYQGSAEHQIISTSKGKKQIRLLLQRQLGIENSELRNIFDKVDRRQSDQVLVAASAHQAFLLGKLYSRGDKRLKDIVETIQRDQDMVIRAPADRPLIINGVAGSGKTSIAYHRLSYLLAPENELNLQLHQARTMILGPNPYFLKYAADVLPGLGMDKIIHTTYNKWALTASGLIFTTTKAPYTVTDRTLEMILKLRKTKAERSLQVELSKLKGSLKFARLLDSYVKHRRNQINVPPQGLRYEDVGIENLKLHLTEAWS